ncbi:MAG: radical SAM protein [Verrucomicrobia bacterium]|nr:radical SAM protein [Verrucomicrobiota bacterium]
MRNEPGASQITVVQSMDKWGAKGLPSHVMPCFWNRTTITAWLQAKDDQQQRLFAAARQARRSNFGDRVIIRGLVEVTNLCRVNCEFCPMRRDNTRGNTIFELSEAQILETAAKIKESGINIVFFQAGEVKKTTQIVGKVLPKIRAMFDGPVELLLCLGNKSEEEYSYLKNQGATSYILKHETSDPKLNEKLRHASFANRIESLKTLVRTGYKVGTGAIAGLPGQTLESLADDLLLARDLGTHMVSASPFIPAPDTPLAQHPPGDVNITLNFIAIARLMNPGWLIPSVSALETRASGGQSAGLAAGANVLTVNFTPPVERKNYLIYGKDRYIVRNDHVNEIVSNSGMERMASVFV